MNAPQTALAQVLPRVHLNVLSNSAIACYRECPRKFKHKYVEKRRPRRNSEALRFGSFFHCGLNAWWDEKGDASDRFSAAIHAMRERAESRPEDADPFDLVKAEELIRGYTVRWAEAGYETIGVEKQFDVPLINPESGRASTRYRVVGSIDVVVRGRDGKIYQVEHKTTKEDIGVGADYWRVVSALDSQVSTYQMSGRALGIAIESTLYDVIRKIGLVPFKETPDEKKQYTKEKSKQCPFCKKKGAPPPPHYVGTEEETGLGLLQTCVDGRIITEPGGQLYKNQHEHDETPEEYRERVRAEIAGNPEKYFARGPIVRLERDEREHGGDLWQTAASIRMAENSGHFPRNPGACRKFGTFCEYFDVCSGNASIDDDVRFRTAEVPHEELQEV